MNTKATITIEVETLAELRTLVAALPSNEDHQAQVLYGAHGEDIVHEVNRELAARLKQTEDDLGFYRRHAEVFARRLNQLGHRAKLNARARRKG